MTDKNEELMAGLTDEERAALGEEGLGDDLAPPSEGGDGKDQVDPPSETQPTEAQAAADAEPEYEQAQRIDSPLRAQAPQNVDQAFAALAQQEETIAQQFDDGELTAKEFREAMNKLAADREEIRWNQRKAELSAEMAETARQNAWEREVADFMTTTGAKIAKSNAAMVAFDEVVKKVTADPANANLSDRAQLDKAYRQFTAEMKEAGVQFETPPAQTPGNKPAPTPPGARPRAVVPTLANVPASEVETFDGGKFAALDRLASTDPSAYEAAVARMSETERAQFESTL